MDFDTQSQDSYQDPRARINSHRQISNPYLLKMSLSKPITTSHYLSPSLAPTPTYLIKWRLLVPRRGDLYLHHLSLLSTDQGINVLKRLVHEYNTSQSWFKRAAPFLVPVIYTAILSPVTSSSPFVTTLLANEL